MSIKNLLVLFLCLVMLPCVAFASEKGKAKVKIYYTGNTYGYLAACPS